MEIEPTGANVDLEEAVQRIQSTIDTHGGTVNSSELIADLERQGLRADTISAALAYAIQQGILEMDWGFELRRPVQFA